jgi:peptidoglycan/LPS O-acetylase OafA/YrhL
VQDRRGTADSHRTRYRADLDGLRAVAVLSVIAYHLSERSLPGGFLGVDIFFVLSGYLITNVIWREALNRELSVARFYERRVRRIMPALVVVLIVVSACSFVMLLPSDLKALSKSALASLSFVANIYFWRGTGYFARSADGKPLLHLWSLGVEEQFYIVFPLLVLLCIRFRRSALMPITAALVLLSLWANFLSTAGNHSEMAFYLLPPRAWELGSGALLALAPFAKVPNPWLRHFLALLATAFLIVGLCLNYGPFRGLLPAALWEVLGATLAIHLGNVGGSWLTSLLSWNPLVWIGLISYSLYLWHWPILVFIRYYYDVHALSPVQELIAFVLMFTLASLSWRYVERPFRDRAMPVAKVLKWVVCGTILVAAGSVAVLAGNGFPFRFSKESARINSAVDTTFRCGLHQTVVFGAASACLLSVPSHNLADATVALLGNSHAQMYAPLVADILSENGREGILVAPESCQPMPDFNQGSSCMAAAQKNLNALEGLPRLQVVILSMTWPGYFSEAKSESTEVHAFPMGDSKTFLESLDRLIESFEQRGKTVVLVGPIAPPGWEAASVVSRSLAFGRKITEPLFLSEGSFMANQGSMITHFSNRSDVLLVRPDLVQCKLDKCDYFRDGASLFSDYSHIAEGALPLFRPEFESVLDQALKPANRSAHDPPFAPNTAERRNVHP